MTFTSEQFLKRKDIVESKFLRSVNYSFNVIKIAAVSRWCKYIFTWVGQSTGPWVCCVSLCVISNQSTSKKPHCVLDFSKLDALLHKTLIKFLMLYQGLTYVYP